MPMNEVQLAFDDLVLDELSVTSIRDSAALPETGASSSSCSSSCSSSSCCEFESAA